MSAEQQNISSAPAEGLDGPSNLFSMQNQAISSSPQSIPGPNSSRRPRACLPCRESKLRCKRNEERPTDDCERCISAGRECIIPAASRRKRQRRNVSNVASLESKFDALVAALKHNQEGDVDQNAVENPTDSASGESRTSLDGWGQWAKLRDQNPVLNISTEARVNMGDTAMMTRSKLRHHCLLSSRGGLIT